MDVEQSNASADSSASVEANQPPLMQERRAKRKYRKRKKKRLPSQPKNPLAAAASSVGESGGLLDSLKNLLPGASHPEPSQSPEKSTGGKTGSNLSPEAEARLDSIPDVIGGAAASPEAVRISESSDSADIAALLDAVAFEEEDVRETVEEFFDFLAERFRSEHWRLTERQSRMLGRPAAQLANAIWAKLKLRIPDILARWCDSTPGATAFLMAAGIVVVPKVMTQVRLSRGKGRTADRPQPQPRAGEPEPRKSAAPHATGPSIGPVPMASGKIGGT